MSETEPKEDCWIDGLGFLRFRRKIIGWTPYDFIWALRGCVYRAARRLVEGEGE